MRSYRHGSIARHASEDISMDTTPLQAANVPETQEPLLSQEEEQSAATSEDVALDEQELADDELAPEDEIEDELIIEDFTIDGICGVY